MQSGHESTGNDREGAITSTEKKGVRIFFGVASRLTEAKRPARYENNCERDEVGPSCASDAVSELLQGLEAAKHPLGAIHPGLRRCGQIRSW